MANTTATHTDAHDASHAVAEHGAAHAESAGLPQLDFTTFGNQIFWLLVALVVIYFLLSRIALPRLGAVLAERSGTITNDIAAADELRLKAVEAENAYNQALADARAEAGRIVGETKDQIQAELDVAISKADAEIAAKAVESDAKIAEIRDGAMDAVKTVAKDTTKEILAALGMKADAKAVTSAVTAKLKG